MKLTAGIVETIVIAAYLWCVATANIRGIERAQGDDTRMETGRARGLEVEVAVAVAVVIVIVIVIVGTTTATVLRWTRTAMATIRITKIAATITTTTESPEHGEVVGTRIIPVPGTTVALAEDPGEVIIIIAMDTGTTVAATTLMAMDMGATIGARHAIETSAGVQDGDEYSNNEVSCKFHSL